MKLLLFSTSQDRSLERISEEAMKAGFETSIFLYESLDIEQIHKILETKWDRAILRDPYNAEIDYSFYLNYFLSNLKCKILDEKAMKTYSSYEDKLFQHLFFEKIVNIPKFGHFHNYDKNKLKSLKYPLIVKRRIASRGKGTFIVKTYKELKQLFKNRVINNFIIQEFKKIKRDLRVIVVNNKILGCVERKVRMKDNHGFTGVGVKVVGKVKTPAYIEKMAKVVAKKIGGDFCGMDFIQDYKGKWYLVECNISPQFVSSERELNVNIAQKIINILKK